MEGLTSNIAKGGESLEACCNGQGPTSNCPIPAALETGHGLDEG